MLSCHRIRPPRLKAAPVALAIYCRFLILLCLRTVVHCPFDYRLVANNMLIGSNTPLTSIPGRIWVCSQQPIHSHLMVIAHMYSLKGQLRGMQSKAVVIIGALILS